MKAASKGKTKGTTIPTGVPQTHKFQDVDHGRVLYREFEDGHFWCRSKLTCQNGCGAVSVVNMKSFLPDNVLAKKHRQRGWDLDPDICPECIEAKRHQPKAIIEERDEIIVVDVPPKAMFDAAASLGKMLESAQRAQAEVNEIIKNVKEEEMNAPTPTARKAERTLLRLLLEHFDADNGVYTEGWSDEKLAETTGLSLKVVREVREDEFGSLAVPPEIKELEDEIQLLDLEVKELQDETKRRMDQMVQSLIDARQKLAALTKKYS